MGGLPDTVRMADHERVGVTRQNGPELLELPVFDPHVHYELETGPVHQYDAAPTSSAERPPALRAAHE
jgi:hypothetical protein